MNEKSEKRQKILRQVRYWAVLNLGTVLTALGVVLFKAPNNFATGGVSGLSIVLSKFITPINGFTEKFLTQTVIMWIINVILLIFGFIFLGKGCSFKTAYCTLAYTLESIALEAVLKAVNVKLPMTQHVFLEFVFAMLLTGAGSAILFNCKASSGGTDIIALILKKYTKMNTGVALLIIDLIVVCVSIFTFQSVEIALFSFMGLFAKSFLLDSVIESIGKTKYITIITTKPDEIAHYILDVIQHGYTIYDAEGGYTHEKKKVLITICKRGEALKLKAKVKELDKQAFVILTDANEILGKGFGDTI